MAGAVCQALPVAQEVQVRESGTLTLADDWTDALAELATPDPDAAGFLAIPGRAARALVAILDQDARSPVILDPDDHRWAGHSLDLPAADLDQNPDPLVEKARPAAKFPVEGQWEERLTPEVSETMARTTRTDTP